MSNDVIKGMSYAHIAIAARDFDKSLAFYSALGMKIYTSWGEKTAAGDTRIALLDMGGGDLVELFAKPDLPADVGQGSPFLHFAFGVQNVDEAYRIALEAGAKPYKAPAEMPLASNPIRMTLRIAFVIGPSGEELEFFKTVVRTI